ncbi:MAG: hypothetical protein ABIA75_03890 [Candidatus Neomarinimicrobiota bacterium]
MRYGVFLTLIEVQTFCATMISDGLKDTGLAENTASKDIAEYVAQALG